MGSVVPIWRALIGVCISVCLALVNTSASTAAEGNIIVSLAEIPTRAEIGPDGQPTGSYVDLFRKIDEAFDGVSFKIGVFPFFRSVNNVISGAADIHFPMIKPLEKSQLPYFWVPESLLYPAFVLYSRKDKRLDPMDDLTGYVIESIGNSEFYSFPFEIGTSESPQQGLKKLSFGRIDGYIGEQGFMDSVLRQEGYTNIHRELYNIVEFGVVVQQTSEGRELAAKLASVIAAMKEDAETRRYLESFYLPFRDWQPYW